MTQILSYHVSISVSCYSRLIDRYIDQLTYHRCMLTEVLIEMYVALSTYRNVYCPKNYRNVCYPKYIKKYMLS